MMDWIGSAPIRRTHPSVRALRSAQKSGWPIMHRSDDQLDLDVRERACVNFPFSHHFQPPMWFEVDRPTIPVAYNFERRVCQPAFVSLEYPVEYPGQSTVLRGRLVMERRSAKTIWRGVYASYDRTPPMHHLRDHVGMRASNAGHRPPCCII